MTPEEWKAEARPFTIAYPAKMQYRTGRHAHSWMNFASLRTDAMPLMLNGGYFHTRENAIKTAVARSTAKPKNSYRLVAQDGSVIGGFQKGEMVYDPFRALVVV